MSKCLFRRAIFGHINISNLIKKGIDFMALLTNCQTCTPPAGSTSILTVNVPGGLAINLLGIHIEVCPVCITVFTGGGTLTAQQQNIANNLLQSIRTFVPNIPDIPSISDTQA
ncbi:hypothetical protein [Bacillus sp. FJAT-53711]